MNYISAKKALGAIDARRAWDAPVVQTAIGPVHRRGVGDLPNADFLASVSTTVPCPAGYIRDIKGNCTKPATASSSSGGVSAALDFLKSAFTENQLAKGRAEGAAEGAMLLAAQQQGGGLGQYMPLILLGGAGLAAFILLRR